MKKIKILLSASFILSLLSIFIALFIVASSISNSPLPAFPYAMIEYMWEFFLITPIPLLSCVLGYIYIKKGYKCKKNIIIGYIMTIFLTLFGSVTSICSSMISHDISYLNQISKETEISFPENIYLSVGYSNDNESIESRAMVKFYDIPNSFEYNILNNQNWKTDLSFCPANIIDMYSLDLTSKYDYYSIFNLTTKTYNNFEGKLIYFAYDLKNNVLYICIYT